MPVILNVLRSLLLRPEPSSDALVTELWQHGTSGIIEEAEGLRAFFDDAAATPLMLDVFASRTIETRTEPMPDPAAFPKQECDPILVGSRFLVAPSWTDAALPPGRIRLSVDSPIAFGTGRHESTQLALQALEELAPSAQTIVDIGSGSGILSQAALLLGVENVFGCDIHSDAIAASRALLHSCLFLGSADAIREGVADLVLANISAKVIDRLAWELQRITKPGGRLILTGFVRENPPLHFVPDNVTQSGDWLCWVCRPQNVAASAKAPASGTHSPQWW